MIIGLICRDRFSGIICLPRIQSLHDLGSNNACFIGWAYDRFILVMFEQTKHAQILSNK
jgi:hypothetical protein